MKKNFSILMLSIIFLFTACRERQQSGYSTAWSQDGKDSVVHVQYVDNNGQMQDFFIDYLMFNSLYRSGGYGNVYNYYNGHRTYYNNYSTRYRTYSSDYQPAASKYYMQSHPSTSYSSPNRRITTNSYSSPSRNSSSNSTNHYSSPSRSSSSHSYSSPSRTSSSSHSYSSPSHSSHR